MKDLSALLLVLALTAASSGTAQAQSTYHYGFKAGVTSAGAAAAADYFPRLRRNRRAGFNAAGFIEWTGLPVVSVVTELGYTQRGFADTRLDYFALPVMAKISYPADGTIRPYLMAGPRLDVLAHRKEGRFERRRAIDWKRATFGGTIGLGMTLKRIAPTPVLLEMRYSFDATDANTSTSTSENAFGGKLTMYNNALSVVAGLSF